MPGKDIFGPFQQARNLLKLGESPHSILCDRKGQIWPLSGSLNANFISAAQTNEFNIVICNKFVWNSLRWRRAVVKTRFAPPNRRYNGEISADLGPRMFGGSAGRKSVL